MKTSWCLKYGRGNRNIDEAERILRALIRWRQQDGIDQLIRLNPDLDSNSVNSIYSSSNNDNNDNNSDSDSVDRISGSGGIGSGTGTGVVVTPLLQKYFPSCFLHGTDLDGDPIWLDRTGASDCVGLHHYYGADHFKTYTLWIREQGLRGSYARNYEHRYGRPPAQVTVIMDMAGLGRRHLHADMIPPLEEGIRILQDYYGGMAKRILVINTPLVFRIVWSIAQHFCNDTLKRTIIMCNARNTPALLDQYIDRSVLPSCMGGQGRPGAGMPQTDMTGGIIPPEVMTKGARIQVTTTAKSRDDSIPSLMQSSSYGADTDTSFDSFSYHSTQESSFVKLPTDKWVSSSPPPTVSVRTSSLLKGSFQDDEIIPYNII